MDIFDLAKATGLSREQIRYYETHGLIANRIWSIRKEFDEHDVSRLKKTVILRKMGVDLSDVRKILDDSVPLDERLAKQLVLLEAEKDKFDGAYNLCVALLERIRFSDEKVKMEYLDADEWHAFVRCEEAAGHAFVDCWQDIDADLDFGLLYPFFVQDFRKNKRFKFLVNAICCIILCAVWVLLDFSESGVWASLAEAGGIIALLLISSLPHYLLGKKHPRAARWLSWIVPISVLVLLLVIVIIAGL
ncbi:MAG: MerR family transcriptional regulator [Clostridia bacterium]|nr:MerR family transcriptional regulator [Clostridia bacterium]